MTFGIHQPLLSTATAPDGVVALGVRHGETALGFALAREGEVLSLFVAPTYWSRGVGTRLLEELERALAARGIRKARMSYSSQASSTSALERVLRKRGWGPPVADMLLVQIEPGLEITPEWVTRFAVPGGFEIFSWPEIIPAEREQLERARAEVPPELWPFAEEGTLDGYCSVGLRRVAGGDDGRMPPARAVAGWMTVHLIAPGLLRFTSLYVLREWRSARTTFALLAEALRRKYAHYGESAAIALAVRMENQPMLKVTERKFRAVARSWDEARRTRKMLRPT